jgi:hypothetical protein
MQLPIKFIIIEIEEMITMHQPYMVYYLFMINLIWFIIYL